MKLDTQTLGEFVEVSDEGAREAATALSRLSGTDIAVDTTGVSVVTGADLGARFGDAGSVGVTVGLNGAFPGDLLLAFDRGGAEAFVEGHQPEEGTALNAMDRSSIKEAATIAAGEFADSLSAHFGEAVELTPPTYYDRVEDATLLSGTPGSAALLLESQLSCPETGNSFSIVTVPGHAAVDQLTTDQAEDAAVSLDGLDEFDTLVRDGAAEAAGLFSAVTGLEATAETTRLRFVSLDAVPASLDDAAVAGTVFGLNDARDGYLAVLFDHRSALSVADAMLPVGGNERFDEMTRSAIEEIGSVMTSGFLDGWADAFDEPLEHTSPAFVEGPGETVLDPLLGRIGTEREHAFVVDTCIRTADGTLDCSILALPADHRLAELQSVRRPGTN